MKVELQILRRANAGDPPRLQRILYEFTDAQTTAAFALHDINENGCTDTEGATVSTIRWMCSCMQKKCGACAMLVNGIPRLACDTKLVEAAQNGVIRLEPLRKFPVIADLIVDRSVMMENLKTMRTWFAEATSADETVGALTYDASRCLQCGCCLEICPNFSAEGSFFGTSAAMTSARLLSALPESQKSEFSRAYRSHFYEGCGKSLACRNICPAGIDIDRLLVNSNAAAIWKRKKAFRVRKEEKP